MCVVFCLIVRYEWVVCKRLSRFECLIKEPHDKCSPSVFITFELLFEQRHNNPSPSEYLFTKVWVIPLVIVIFKIYIDLTYQYGVRPLMEMVLGHIGRPK